jgi:hypothetical protein
MKEEKDIKKKEEFIKDVKENMREEKNEKGKTRERMTK